MCTISRTPSSSPLQWGRTREGAEGPQTRKCILTLSLVGFSGAAPVKVRKGKQRLHWRLAAPASVGPHP